MGDISTLQDLDKFLASPLDKKKQERPAMGPPPPPPKTAESPKQALPNFNSVQELDSFLKTPLKSYDTTPIEKWKKAQSMPETPDAGHISALPPESKVLPKWADRAIEKIGDTKVAGDLTFRQAYKNFESPLGRGASGSEEDKVIQFRQKYAGQPLTITSFMEGAQLGVGQAMFGMLSPENMSLLVGMGALPPRSAVKMLVDAGFTYQMAQGTLEGVKGATAAFQRGDAAEAVRQLTGTAVTAGFAYMSGSELAHEAEVNLRAARMRDSAMKRLDEVSQAQFKKPWSGLNRHEQAAVTYGLATSANAPVSASTALRMGVKLPGDEGGAFAQAMKVANDLAKGTAGAREAVPMQMAPTPEPSGISDFDKYGSQLDDLVQQKNRAVRLGDEKESLRLSQEMDRVRAEQEKSITAKVSYNPATGGTELSVYLNPEEREAKGYYTLEEARKRLDEERRVETEAQESRSRAEGEQQRISREKAEQSEGEAAYRAARAGKLVVTDRRGMQFDEEGAERNKQERSRLSDELNRLANENMYYDAEDMFQSLDTEKGRGEKLGEKPGEEWKAEVLGLQNKLKDLERLSNPEALAPVRTANFQGLAEDTKLASREGEMRDVASILDEEAKKVVGDVDEFERLQAEADEARDRAEKLRTERDKKDSERAAETSERAEYPLGAPMKATMGTGGSLILPDGRKIPFHYAVVPMESVVSSHDPFNNFEPNPEAIAVSQGRDYKNNRESQAATIARGKNPEMALLVNTSPTAETGPPIVRQDGQGMGGRNRINIWKLLYRNGFEDMAYQYMTEHAREYGVTPEQVANLYTTGENPMIVRVLDDPFTSAESIAQLGRDLDRTQTMGFSDAETAVMAGRSLDTDTLDWISNQLDAMGEDSSLRDLMRFRSGEIIDKMLASGMIEPTKRSEFVTSTGEMTERAKNLFESAVLGKVIDDAELLSTTPKDILRKLERSVAALARVKAAGGVWDFTPELKGALRLWKRVDSIREALNKIGGPDDSLVDRYLHPGEYKMGTELMDFGGETAREQPHPTVEALAKLMEEPGKEIKLAVGDYADDSEGKQMTLGPPPSPVESFNRHIASKVKVDVPEEAWGTLKAPETPKEADTEGPKETAPDVPPPLETKPAQAAGMANTATELEALAGRNPKTAPMAKELVEALGIVVKGQTGLELDEWLKKNKISIQDEGTPGEGAMSQSAADVSAWARRAGRKLSITPYGEQLDIFGGSEPQFLLRDKAGIERLVLKSELLKVREAVPRVAELVDSEGNIQQAGLFGAEEENLFGPGEDVPDEGPQGTLFQDKTIADIAQPKRDTDTLKQVQAEHPDWSLSQQLQEAAKRVKEPLRQGPKGATEFLDDGRTIITLFRDKADASTFLHEFFHTMRRYLKPEDLAVLEKWQGVKDGIWTRTHEEEAARAWEHYHRQTPAKTLPEKVRMVFKRIQDTMRKIYESLKKGEQGKDWRDVLVKPSKEVAALFDRWYGKEMEATPEAKAKPQKAKADLYGIDAEKDPEKQALMTKAIATGQLQHFQQVFPDATVEQYREFLPKAEHAARVGGFWDDPWTLETASAYKPGHPWANPAKYPTATDAGMRDSPFTLADDWETSRGREPRPETPKGRKAIEEALADKKKNIDRAKSSYDKLREKLIADGESAPLDERGSLASSYAHLTWDNSQIDMLERALRGDKSAIGKKGPKTPQMTPPPVQDLDKPPTKYKFGNTQANIPGSSEAATALNAARDRIADADLAGKGKDVDGNHVTVRYGIKGEDNAGIKRFLSTQQPFEATLGKTETFPPSESSDGAAVIKAPIEAPELHRLNDELQKHGEFTDPTFKYSPHATVAYVKPEAAEKYVGMDVTEGKKFTISEIAISDRNGDKEIVKLGEPLPAPTEKIKPAAEMEAPPLSAEDRKDMEMKAQAGILPLDTGKVRVKVFPEFQKAVDWAKANQGKIKGLQVFQLKDGRAVVDFTAKNEKVLFQSDPDYEKQRLIAHTNVKISSLLDRLKHVMPEMERVKVNAEIQALRARRDAAMNPPKSMTPPPGEILTLWTPEGERPIERPSGSLPTEKKASDTERGTVDVSHGNRQPGRAREISEPPVPPRLGESEPGSGRGTRPTGRTEAKGATTGEPRIALRDVKPLEIAPSKPRGAPAYAAKDWSDRVEKFKLPENAPAPTVTLKPENARMMMPGQAEVVESILSGLQQHDGYILATTTGTGKTYMGSAVLNEMSKPNSRNLILTPSQGLIHGRDGWIRVAGNFGVEVKPLEVGEMPTEPGTYIATWAGGLTREGIDQLPWDMIVMDEVQEARKWWSSKRGDMSKTMGENAKKILYTSATPFHTALEMGHMGKLGLWGREGFAQWAMKNNLGVYFDKDGNLAGGAAPARLEKLRQQLIERGQFINIDRNMEGYSAHFGKVPMDGKTAQGLRDIDKALQLAENYFAASKRKGMIATTKAQRVTLAKRWLEFQRLPQAIELGKKLEKEGWKVIFFSENKKEFNELFDFLQPADAATGGKISALMPKFGSTIDVLRESFGDDVAVFSGKHSAAREAEKDAFNDDDKKHLYATYSAGGVGVSLHDKGGDKPRAVVYLGPPWSGISFDQALGRPWRYGTKSNVRAYFLFSDSQAEMDLVTNKVAPRMESLRAMVSGVDFKDPVVKNLREVPENQEGALDYDHGNAHNADFDAFTRKADMSGVSSYSELPIVSAKEAMNKGMKLPGAEGAQDPSVIRLWQDGVDDEVLPADLEAPELTMARQVNVELAERFIETGAAPGNAAGRSLKPQDRRVVADAVLARADAAAAGDPASATQQVYTEWENAMKQIDGILALANGGGMEPPPEGVPNVPGSGGETPKPFKMSTWDAVNWYMFTNGRDVMRDVTKRAGVGWVGEKLARSVAQYHTEAGNISGPWETSYWDILKDNKITPEEHKVLALTLANREKPAKWIDAELARLRATAPMNERIEKAVKQTQDLFKEVFNRMQKDNIYLTVHDAATGRPRQIYYNEFAAGEGYFPRRYDYAQVHAVVDPETGLEHKFTLADLTDQEPGESKREGIIRGMMERHGLSRSSVEDWLASKKRDVPLVGHIERAREADLPFFRTDPDVVISYLEGAGELLSRKKYFEQDGSKVKGLIAQIPAQKAREIVGGIMDSLLQRNPLHDESKAILRWTSNWAVSKMVFSSIKALTHSIHAAPLTNTRAYLKGVFAGLTDLKDVQRMAQLAGSIQEQTKIEMLAEYGVKKSGFGSKLLTKTGWQGTYKWGRVVTDATARIFMTDYAMGKLMKDPKNEVVRRQLRNNMQLDDSRIDAAIARRRWTEEDLAWGGKSLADKAMMTFDKTELPPTWRPRSDDPASDFGGTLLRAATILKGYQFKAHAVMKDAIWDEARKGNFRPLIPFLLLYPLAGQTIWSLTALATGNIKHFKQLMDDKSWTPGQTVWRMIEDVAHIMADSEITAFFDAAAHGKEILAGKIGTEYLMGPLPSDIGKTVMLPVDLAHAKTAKAKAAAVKRYVENINPAARTLINSYEMADPPSQGGRGMAPLPVIHR